MSAGGGGLDGLVHCIHASRTAAALALTGGGTGAIPLLLRRPGGSRTVLDVAVPYGPKAVAAYLGETPAQACSAETAQLLARRAFRRAVELRPDASIPVVGLGATAALATDRVRRGEDRLHAAAFDGARTLALEWQFQLPHSNRKPLHNPAAVARKTLTPTLSQREREQERPNLRGRRMSGEGRDRQAQETAAERAIVSLLADAVGVAPWRELAGSDLACVGRTIEVEDDELACVRDGLQPWVTAYPDGQRRPGGQIPTALVPGSFNPWHEAHRALWEAARRRFGDPVAYELSITNVDKPPLPTGEVLQRAAQFRGRAGLVLTAAPTFVEKSRLLPGAAFAVGADTARRIVEPMYYGGVEAMRTALQELRCLGGRFVVAGRLEDGRFLQLDDLALPPEAEGLFEAIPADELRVDVSSTALRAKRATGT